jgi:hypothetical protein
MLDKDIQEIINSKLDKSPIFYGSVKFRFKINRKFYPFQADKIVMKGTILQIKQNPKIKQKVILAHFGNNKAGKLKARAVDLEKIIIDKLIINKFLSYGIKCE